MRDFTAATKALISLIFGPRVVSGSAMENPRE
jgi:hypothetical protein